jgi:hypothetical protein
MEITHRIHIPANLRRGGGAESLGAQWKMGGLQSRSGHVGEDKYVLSLPEIEPQFLGDPPHSLVTTPAIVVRT